MWSSLGVFASLAQAYLSYERFESRFLRLKRPFETDKEPNAPAPHSIFRCNSICQLACG